MKRIALAFVEGAVRELGGLDVERFEDWLEDRRRRRPEDEPEACPTCGRWLCCPVHAVDGTGRPVAPNGVEQPHGARAVSVAPRPSGPYSGRAAPMGALERRARAVLRAVRDFKSWLNKAVRS